MKKINIFNILKNNTVAAICLISLPIMAAETAPTSQNETQTKTKIASLDFDRATKISHFLNPKKLFLRSSAAVIMDTNDGNILYAKDSQEMRSIASLTKLMTAMVILDSKLPLNEKIKITKKDRDRLRGSKSRLAYGSIITREDLLLLALAASENRATAALARTYPGGKAAFVKAMNQKAKTLGMQNTSFKDSSGLHSQNISTANDLVKLVAASYKYSEIREMSTTGKHYVTDLRSGWKVEFLNTNRLVRRKQWNIGLSKTGYLADAGNCLVMQTEISGHPVIIVLLNSWGKLSKFGDANRIKRWLINAEKKRQRVAANI